MSILSAIRHFVRIALFIVCTPLPPRPEVQLSTGLVTVKDEDGNSQGQVVEHR